LIPPAIVRVPVSAIEGLIHCMDPQGFLTMLLMQAVYHSSPRVLVPDYTKLAPLVRIENAPEPRN